VRYATSRHRSSRAPGARAQRALPVLLLALVAFAVLGVRLAQALPLPTTRNDFAAPGTQPLSLTDTLSTPDQCTPCHSDYGFTAVEPFRNWAGSMMAQAGRDPLMYAAMAIANQDSPAAGETCLRCHLPKGWLEGRSVPEDGTAMTAPDREGVQCTACHRLVDPFNNPGAPAEDAAILAALTDPVPTFGNAMMVMDPEERLRGPFDIVADIGSDPHIPDSETLVSPFHQTSELCGTCHNLFNPIFTRNVLGEYELNPFDTPTADLRAGFPEQQTYDEWAASEYASTGVFAPQFGINKDVVSTCQDCHMPDVSGRDAEGGAFRDDLPLHQMVGANTFIPDVLPFHPVFGSEVDAAILQESISNATDMLRRAATVEAGISGGNLTVRVTNETGHKLPTGYPEGRRMWLHVRAFDSSRAVVFESGRYVFDTADLLGYESLPADPDYDPDLHVWETIHGISSDVALIAGATPGPSFHLLLNNVREFDNRIPPRGFDNATFEALDAHPVGQAYADGQYWDDVVYAVGSEAVQAEVTLYYQTSSKEYIEFLRDENTTTAAGPILFDLWDQHNKSEPVVMAQAFVETDAKTVAKCQKGVAKAQSKYHKTYQKEWGRCYERRASGGSCDAGARDTRVAAAEAGLRERVGGSKDKRCMGANLTPISIGHGATCPVPCPTTTLFDMTDVASCAVCMSEALADSALDAAYGTPPPALPPIAPAGGAGKCQASVAKASLKLAGDWSKELVRCGGDNASGRNNPPVDCETDPSGKIGRAQEKSASRIAGCTDFMGLAGCPASGTAVDTASCVETAIGDVVPEFASVGYP
jgi:hypothetical protein